MPPIKDAPGAAIIAKELEVNCMKWSPKPPLEGQALYIYTAREGSAVVLLAIPDERKPVGKFQATLNIGFQAGDSISGKLLWVCSDAAAGKPVIGTAKSRSARHSRQEVNVKAEKRCCAFLFSSWRGENIDPPDPWAHLRPLLA